MTRTGRHPAPGRADASLATPWETSARRLADGLGQATAQRRALPGLLIAGGQRCGTTSMYQALIQQPHVFRPTWRKGVHYFDVAHHRGLEWYRSHFPLRTTLRAASRRHGAAVCFESSPYYLFHPAAPARIAATLPQVKVLVLVRDPVERAYSAHAHEVARGFEDLDFADALVVEPARLAGEEERLLEDPTYESHAHRHQAYRSRGEYARQVSRLADLLGPAQVKVVDSHRFFATPAPVYREVLTWLGLEQVAPVRFEQHNARPRLPIDPGLAAELRSHYAPHDQALERWLGHVPSWHG